MICNVVIFTIKAIKIATNAHEEQVDKAGKPYIDHPLRVMNMGVTDDEKIVGVLHDVVEDCDWNFEQLVAKNAPLDRLDKFMDIMSGRHNVLNGERLLDNQDLC